MRSFSKIINTEWFPILPYGHNEQSESLKGYVKNFMRGLKQDATPVLAGYQMYHNFIRPHEALSGKTPADVCGIVIEGGNKWKTIIENAAKAKS